MTVKASIAHITLRAYPLAFSKKALTPVAATSSPAAQIVFMDFCPDKIKFF